MLKGTTPQAIAAQRQKREEEDEMRAQETSRVRAADANFSYNERPFPVLFVISFVHITGVVSLDSYCTDIICIQLTPRSIMYVNM